MKVDKRMLVDSFDYLELTGKDDYQKNSYADPIKIELVRIDRTTQFSRDAKDTKILANAVIYCYADWTTPLPEFKEQSQVVFDGKEHVITNVVMNKHPFKDEVWSYELEVV